MFYLSRRSKARLSGVHSDLASVVMRAIEITEVDFGVSEGLRTPERQAELYAAKKTTTLNSRHITGHAVDLYAYVNGAVSWDMSAYRLLASAMKRAASELGVKIKWGGDWKSFKDGPHFELDREVYPDA